MHELEANWDQSGKRNDNQPWEDNRNFLSSRLKTGSESIVLIPFGREFQSRTHENANAEGQLERAFDTWKLEQLPRVPYECVSDIETIFESLYEDQILRIYEMTSSYPRFFLARPYLMSIFRRTW